jgi:hypothetical protein
MSLEFQMSFTRRKGNNTTDFIGKNSWNLYTCENREGESELSSTEDAC